MLTQRSSHDIFKHEQIIKQFAISDSNKLMEETAQKMVAKRLRLFANITADIQMLFAYQFSG